MGATVRKANHMSKNHLKKHHKQDCNCIFCQSKCPECNSQHISVRLNIFNTEYSYINETENEINVETSSDYIECEATCLVCKSHFENELLKNALLRNLDIPFEYNITIDDNGDITTTSTTE